MHGRLIASVLLPFAAGYFLSYVFRTVNAVIATDLAAELGLNAADLGLLAGVYFLLYFAHHVFSAVYVLYAGHRYALSTLEIVSLQRGPLP